MAKEEAFFVVEEESLASYLFHSAHILNVVIEEDWGIHPIYINMYVSVVYMLPYIGFQVGKLVNVGSQSLFGILIALVVILQLREMCGREHAYLEMFWLYFLQSTLVIVVG